MIEKKKKKYLRKNLLINKNTFEMLIVFAVLIITSTVLLSCETEAPKPDTPIFSDVEILEVSESIDPSGTYLFENLPSYVKNIQVLIFADADEPVIDDSNKLIKNISSMKGGNRTGLTGITRTEVSAFYSYDTGTGDLDSGTVMAPGITGTDWFIVLGFDETLNLTHASPKYLESDL